jgi:hypothetical protein
VTGLEALQSVQFVTVKGRRFAILDADDWEGLVDWLETIEDVKVAAEFLRSLDAVGGERQKADLLRWDDVKDELG